MKLFFSYLKMKIKSIALFACFSAVFFVIAYLYSAPVEAAVYSCALCLAVEILFLICGFFSFRKKHISLAVLAENPEMADSAMPEPKNILEEDYTLLAEALRASLAKTVTQNDALISEMNDYYTLWAHQIKTPIAAMRLLLQQNENDEIEEQLFKIEQYVDMVLTYIRCGDDSSDYVIKEYNLDEIIKPTLRKFGKSFIRKRLTLSYTPTETRVVTDEKWLSFVIGQIISNALKYTKTGSIAIFSEDKNTLVISDTGVGIAPEDLPRIMQKGYTGCNGRQDKKSTGLGLFLSKKILDSLGHALIIESDGETGTTVKIIFENEKIKYE